MALQFTCLHCGSNIRVRFLKAGETAQCKACGQNNTVPTDAQEVAASDPIPQQFSSVQFSSTPDYTYALIQDNQQQYEQPHIPITNPYLQIWTEPRATFRHVVKERKLAEGLLIYGTSTVFSSFNSFLLYPLPSPSNESETSPTVFMFFFGLFGMLGSIFLAAAVNRIACKIVGGIGNYRDTLTTMTWSSLPGVTTALFALPMIFYEMFCAFTSQPITHAGTAGTILYVIFSLVVSGYSFVLVVIGFSETHRISIGQAIGAIAIIFAAIFIFVIALIMCLGLLLVSAGKAAH